MADAGSLQVTLEVTGEGTFTTSINRAGSALDALGTKANITVNAVQNVSTSMDSSITSIGSWALALGGAEHAIRSLTESFSGFISKIVEVNSHIEQTTALLAGFSNASSQIDRLKEGMSEVNTIMTMATQTPFSFNALQDTFVKFKTTGIDPLAGGMKNLTDAIAAFGGDDSRLTRAGYAIQEMAGRGVISLQNLRRQLGQDIPGAVQAMAQSMFMTVEQLDAAVTKGTLDAKTAIDAMDAEFGRLYGGAGLQRMQTFKGQIAQITTELMRLAQVAGGMQEGASKDTSSYSALVSGMSELSKVLASPEMTAAAVTINDTLKGFAEGITKLLPLIPQLTSSVQYLGAAMMLASAGGAAALLVKLGPVMVGALAAMSSNILGLGRALVMLPEFIGAAGTAIAMFGRAMLVSASGMTAAAVAGTGLAGVFAGLSIAAVTVGIPVALAAALAYYVFHAKTATGATEELGASLKRLREGDITQPNIDKSTAELKHLQEKKKLLEEQLSLLERIKANDKTAKISDLANVEGAMGNDGIRLRSQRFGDSTFGADDASEQGKKLQAATDRVKTMLAEMNADINSYSADLAAAPSKLIDKKVDLVYEEVNTRIAQHSQVIIANYRASMKQIEDARNDAMKDPGDQGNVLNINKTQKNITSSLYDSQLAVREEELRRETALVEQYAKAGDKQASEVHKRTAERMKVDIDKFIQESDRALESLGLSKVLDGTKEYDKQIKEAETSTKNLEEQAAGLRAQLEGAGSAAAKVRQEFSATGKYSQLGGIESPEGQAKLIAAEEVDRDRAAVKAYNEELKASDRLVTGYDKIEAQLDGLALKMTNPQMPEAQRSFVIEQEQMTRALNDFLSHLDLSKLDDWAKMLAGIATYNKSIRDGLLAASVAEATTTANKIHGQFVGSMPPELRAKQEYNDTLKSITEQRKSLNQQLAEATTNSDTKNAGIIQTALGLLDKSEGEAAGAEKNRLSKAGASASRPSEDVLTQMVGRIAELKAQISGADSELAKWQARLDQDPKKYSAERDAILASAKAIDELTKSKKLADAATSAVNQIDTNLQNAKNEQTILDQELLSKGKLLTYEREIMNVRLRAQAALDRVAAGPNASTQLPDAEIRARADVFQESHNILLKTVAANKTAELTIRSGFADTLSARKAAGEEEINHLQDSLEKDIQLYTVEGAQRQEIERQTADYIAAKREELARKTENALQKQAREWGDSLTQLESFGGNAMNKFMDELELKLTTGKAKWTDFADWAIKELLRIQLKTAAAPLADAASKGLTSIAGSIFGSSSASPISSGPKTPDPVTGLAMAHHSGGMAGLEPTFYKSVDMSVFNNATKYHTGGLAGDEVPAILQKGEGVFTTGQMGAIGSLNHNYAFVESALQALVGAARTLSSIPASAAPAASYGTTAAGAAHQTIGSAPPVTLNVNNQTSAPISAVSSTPKFDGEKMVIDIVIRNVSQPGPMRDAIKGIR